MHSPTSIIWFWYLLEQQVPFDLSRTLKDANFFTVDTNSTNQELPWINPSLLRQRHHLATLNHQGKPIRYLYRVYLGVFEVGELFRFWRDRSSIQESFAELFTDERAYTCYASFSVDSDGIPVDEPPMVTTAPWILGQTRGNIATYQQWTREFQAYQERVGETFSAMAQAIAEAGHQLDLTTINDLLSYVARYCGWQPPQFFHQAAVVIYQENERPPDDILNSFLLEDLERAYQAVNSGSVGKALASYLGNPPANRVDLESKQALQTWLLPEDIPLGRWPEKPNYKLSLMQQCAVNLVKAQLSEKAGLFSVNGPPGTGKTTMLRDIVADILVQRAERMVEYEQPREAFSQVATVPVNWSSREQPIYAIDAKLTGYEVVVTSSNNAAVENVTRELPALSEIAPEYQVDADYFRSVAQSLAGENIEVWGLIAAVLGKSDNRSKFVDAFWFGQSSGETIRQILAAAADDPLTREQWQEARRDFARCKQRVQSLLAKRQEYMQLPSQLSELERSFHEAQQTQLRAQGELQRITGEHAQAHAAFERAREQQEEHRVAIETLKKTQPPWWMRWLGGVIWRHPRLVRYENSIEEARQEFVAARSHLQRCREAVEVVSKQQEQCRTLLEQARMRQLQVQEESAVCNATLNDARQELGDAFADQKWWNQEYSKLQLAAPWLDQTLNDARSRLFLSALKVHAAFIRSAARPIKSNLTLCKELLKGQAPGQSKRTVSLLWQTFFLVVPVVSTTFASAGRMFSKLGQESLGWLLIDEAGQAVPQAAVGALWRARRAVVVGDPLQIEPVFTLDEAVVEGLRQYFRLDGCWSPLAYSVQSLADRANPYGTTISTEDQSLWIGCPLWVHRRCIEPMTTIANRIAYDGRMVIATSSPAEDKQFSLGQSRWIDISGQCRGRHWVPEQGSRAVEMLAKVVRAEVVREESNLPSLYLISPFKKVAEELRCLLRSQREQWAPGYSAEEVTNWCKHSVGTVHIAIPNNL